MGGFSPGMGHSETANEIEVRKSVSSGTIFLVDEIGHYVMIQKENGKRVSLELTGETEVTLDGKTLSLENLGSLKKGYTATAEHFTNDAGMQRTMWLKVGKGMAQ
jgi:hypothetical protein